MCVGGGGPSCWKPLRASFSVSNDITFCISSVYQSKNKPYSFPNVVRQQPPLPPPHFNSVYINYACQALPATHGPSRPTVCSQVTVPPPVGGWHHWHRRAWRPQQGYLCLAKLSIYLSPSTSPSLFLPLSLYHSPLVTLCLFLFAFTPFSFPSLWGAFTYSPFHGNGLAPRGSPIAVVPYICIGYSRADRPLGRTRTDRLSRRDRLGERRRLKSEQTEDRHRLRKGENKEGRVLETGTRTTQYIRYTIGWTAHCYRPWINLSQLLVISTSSLWVALSFRGEYNYYTHGIPAHHQ